MKNLIFAALAAILAGCTVCSEKVETSKWQPIGKRKAKVALWGIVHNHARGKFDALRKLKDDYEIIGWVDDSDSKAMRMQEPNVKSYSQWPKIDGEKLLAYINAVLDSKANSNSTPTAPSLDKVSTVN